MASLVAVEAFAFPHQLGSVVRSDSGVGQRRGSGFFLDSSAGSRGGSGTHASLGTSVLSILLDSVAHDFKAARGLGAERGKLSKGSIGVDFSHSQLLQLGCDSVVQFILQVIIRNTCFSSKVQELREEVMELVGCLHVELLELVLCSSHLVWVIIDSLQVFKHVNRVFIQVHRFTSESRYDVLASFSITMTSHIGTTKLGGVIVIMISLKFLGHQKQPIFKLGFFSISEQQRVGNLS